jgi:hypothetical protein
VNTVEIIAQQFLYMFGPRAGDLLLLHFKQELSQRPEAIRWLQDALASDATSLIECAESEGDDGDRLICLDVFLWKQRHGLISASHRIKADFLKDPLTGYIHRYMVANGYNDVLNVPIGERGVTYLKEIYGLLDEFKDPGFNEGERYWNLIHFLNVLGPRISEFYRKNEVVQFAQYLMTHSHSDPSLQNLADDVDFSGYALLTLDLGLQPGVTWPAYKSLLLKSTRRSAMSYPALMAGLQMYPNEVPAIIDQLDLQGGKELFWSLVRA